MQDLTGRDSGDSLQSTEQLEQLGQQLARSSDLQAKYFSAQSNLRDAQVGYWFELHGHAEIDQHPQTEREFLILSKQFYNQNNLAPELRQHFLSLLQQSQWTFQLPLEGDPQQFCQLNLIRRHIALVPEFNPLLHRPVAYPQRAKVVGPEDETVHVDAWGRIKVRFLFTRSDDHLHDGGAGANDNEDDRRGWMYSHRGQVRVMVQDFTHVLVKLWWWISLMAILIVLLWLDVYMRQNDNRHNSIQLELYPIPNT